jgi:hypothetical protein
MIAGPVIKKKGGPACVQKMGYGPKEVYQGKKLLPTEVPVVAAFENVSTLLFIRGL